MKILLFLYLYIFTAFEYSYGATYKKLGNIPDSMLIFDKEHSDIRIDYNHDGKIDFWSVKSGSIQIDIFFVNQLVNKKFVRKFYPHYVLEYFYKMEKNQLKLQWAKKRALLSMNISKSKNEFCAVNTTDIKKQIASLSQRVNEDVIYTAIDNLIDPKCKSSLPKESFQKLEKNLFNILSADQNPLLECFSDSRFMDSFAKSEDSQLQIKVLSARFELLRLQLSVNSEVHRPTISCAGPPSNKEIAHAQTLENNKVTLFTPLEIEKLSDILTHEFLHMTEVSSETDVESIADICKKIKDPTYVVATGKNKMPPILSGNVSAATVAQANEESANILDKRSENIGTTLASVSNSNQSVINVASQDLTAAIPAEMTVQQSGVPSVAALSASLNSPYPMTDEGAEAALKVSKELSAPLLVTANKFLGAMNSSALANTSTLASGPKIKTKGLAPDERIVEQITLNDSTPSTVPSSATTVNGKTPPTEVSKLEAPARKNLPGQATTELKGSPESFTAGPTGDSRSPASIGGQITSSNSTTSVNRKAANASQRQTPSVSPDEVITFISRVDYATAKMKLQDSSFTQQLASQGITILDLNGNTYGAKKGSVIFLDEGNRFVRQK